MREIEWSAVPVGIDAKRWTTGGSRRNVLVAAHTLVSTQRLLDVVGLVEGDRQVQVVYTRPPDVFHRGVGEFLRAAGALEISWQQAVHERFDLALAAAYGGLPELHAPVMVLPHGASYAKHTPRHEAAGRPANRGVYGLGVEHLIQDGRVVPASIVLSHDRQLELLAASCPEATDYALVAGDPCYDRLCASLPLRPGYRDALGVDPARQLVVVASTWGGDSLLGRHDDLLDSLLRQLDPRRYQVAALIHPAVWFGHGRRQVRAWLSDECAAGLILVEPEVDWRAAAVAADYIVGDHGSVTVYAAAIGKPVLHTDVPEGELDSHSPQAFVGGRAPRLVRSARLEPQLRLAADELPPTWAEDVSARLTSRPGASHRLLRQEMYKLLDLPIPGRHRAVEPVAVPWLGGACRYA